MKIIRVGPLSQQGLQPMLFHLQRPLAPERQDRTRAQRVFLGYYEICSNVKNNNWKVDSPFTTTQQQQGSSSGSSSSSISGTLFTDDSWSSSSPHQTSDSAVTSALTRSTTTATITCAVWFTAGLEISPRTWSPASASCLSFFSFHSSTNITNINLNWLNECCYCCLLYYSLFFILIVDCTDWNNTTASIVINTWCWYKLKWIHKNKVYNVTEMIIFMSHQFYSEHNQPGERVCMMLACFDPL